MNSRERLPAPRGARDGLLTLARAMPVWLRRTLLPLAGTALIGMAPAANSSHGRHAPGPDPAAAANTVCPVTPEEAIDPGIYLDYEERRIYFCCARCRNLFLGHPETYRDNLPQFASGGLTGAEEEPGHSDTHHKPDAPPNGHDHGTEHTTMNLGARLGRFVGKLHPLLVHFPIALTLAAGLAEALSVRARREVFFPIAHFLILLAGASALAAVPAGWLLAGSSSYPETLSAALEWHRWAGTVAGGLVITTAVLAELLRRSEGSRAAWQTVYRLLLAATCLLIIFTGHMGGTLVFGPNYFKF